MVGQQVRGMTNDHNLSSDTAVAALLKHLWMYSIGEGGLNSMPAHAGKREVLSEFAEVFRSGVRNGAQGVMASYVSTSVAGHPCIRRDTRDGLCVHVPCVTFACSRQNEVDGVPVIADSFVLIETLRQSWNFSGYVTADFGAIRRLVSSHFTAETPKDAVLQYIAAGGNMQGFDYAADEGVPSPIITYQTAIVDLVAEGALPQATLDERVADVLRVKARLGLFDQPLINESLAAVYNDAPEHRQLAEEAAEQVITVLENRGGVLPFSSETIKTLAVVGPNSDNPRCGDYTACGHSACGANTINNRNTVSVLAGLKRLLAPSNTTILHVPAVGIFDRETLDKHHKPHNLLEPIQAHHWDNLTASYFNNTKLSGEPFIIRTEPAVSHAWFNYGPCGVPFGALGGPEDGCAGVKQPVAATFSVRWEGLLTSDASVDNLLRLWLHGGDASPGVPPYKPPPGPPGGNHSHPQKIHAPVLTGARVWVDGKKLIDIWDPHDRSNSNDTARASMIAGESRRVVVEYWIADGLGSQPGIQLQWDQTTPTGIAAASAAASEADATVVVVGDSQSSSAEGIDRADLSLPGTHQLALVKAIHAVTQTHPNKRMVVVFVSGRPVAEPWIKDNVAAVVHAWQAGQAQGTAVAVILSSALKTTSAPLHLCHQTECPRCISAIKPIAAGLITLD